MKSSSRSNSDEQVVADVPAPDPTGHGDYTQERHELFADLEIEDLMASIRRQETGSADDE